VPKKFKTKASAGEVMLTIFWHSEDVVIVDFLEKGATVNSELYIETLRSLKKCIMRKGPEIDDVLLQHNNVRLHTSATTSDAISHLGFTALPHPVY
jgi:hypothetical protein